MMKKMLAMIMALMLAVMGCCAAMAEETNAMMMGGW